MTAIELLAALSIVAILSAMAVPAFRDFMQNNRAAIGETEDQVTDHANHDYEPLSEVGALYIPTRLGFKLVGSRRRMSIAGDFKWDDFR